MMKLSVIQNLKIIFTLAFAVLLINVVIAYNNTIKLINNQQLVTCSHAVIAQIETIFIALKDAETAQRNYLISTDMNELKIYLDTRQQTNHNIQILRKLTTKNYATQQWIAVLEKKTTNRFATLQQEVSLNQSQGFAAVQKLVLSDKNKISTQDIPQLIREGLAAEQKLLQKYKHQSQANSQKALVTFSLMVFVDFVLLTLFQNLMWRYITRLQYTELTLRQNENRLQAIIDTETTQKKRLEAQILRSQRLESIGSLAGGIAHDLNNVLSPILMSIHLLQMKLPDEQSQRVLQTLDKNVKRGANLLKQILLFARGTEGTKSIIQIKYLLEEIEEIIQQTFPKSIVCHIDIPENLWVMSGDTTQLYQVLINLVVNARDAMPNGGLLTITAENVVLDDHYTKMNMNIDAQAGSYIAISVQDTGTGISAEIQERIFEPFFTTKDVGKGTGLGLSTTLGIIKNHGGFMNVYSETGKGTQFKVYLPVLTSSIQEVSGK
jgi:signal transduction histidine kinase